MSRVINQNTEPLFIFDMPDDEVLANTISVKGEKGERGDPTKLSQLENDEGFIDNTVDDLSNYYDKTTTDTKLDAKLDKATFNAYEIPSDFYTSGETVSGTGTSVALANTSATVFKTIAFYGNIAQDGAPTPSAPVDVDTVTGEQSIAITGDGTQAYTVNLGDIELCKFGNHQDYIYKHDGKWYKKSEVGKYTVAGNEAFVWDATIPRLYLATSTLADLGINCVFPSSASVVAAALSNKFTVKTFTQVYTNKQGGFAMSTSGRNWQFSDLGWSEEEDAMADIAGTVVYYALAEPAEDEITDPILISQLEAIERAKSYNGTTIITATGTLPAVLYVEGYKNGWSGTIDGINADLATKTDINGLRHRPYCYNTVAEMVKDNLTDGDLAITSGYYDAGDGGGAQYKITSASSYDGFFSVALANGKVAEMIADEPVDIRKIGATTSADVHDYILAVVNNNHECFIPSGQWKTSPLQIAKYDSARIKGQPIYGNNNNKGTILTPIGNQDYILKVGYDNNTSIANDITIENIQFNTNGYEVVNAVLFSRVQFGKFDELCFRNCKCSDCAFRVRETWETDFGRIMFRVIDSDYCLIFGNKIGNGNISTNYTRFISFEGMRGNCIKFEPDCAYSMNVIDTLDFESGTATFGNEVRQGITSVSSYTPHSIIETTGGYAEIAIENINLNAIAQYAYVDGDNARATDRIIESSSSDAGYVSFYIGDINGVGNAITPILINANTLDKFYCVSNIFRGGQAFICNVVGCRVFKYLPNDFCDNYFIANIERAYRDLKITNNKPSCVGTSRAVRVATLKKTGSTLNFHAKGTGQVYFGTAHMTATDADNFAWYSLDISSLTNGESYNLLLATNASVELDDYYIS